MRSAKVWLAALIGLTSCSGSDEPTDITLYADPGQLAFGDVEIGQTSKAIITLTALEGGNVEIESITMRPLDQLTWGFSAETMSGASIALEVEYHPVGPGASAVELVVIAKNADPIVLLIGGNGVEPAELRVGKLRFSFGTVMVGSSSAETSTIENKHPTSGTVVFDPGLNVDHCDAAGSELNSFCVTFEGKTLDSNRRFPIDPSETFGFTVRFIPLDAMVTEQADFELSTCPEEMCVVKLVLDGTGG